MALDFFLMTATYLILKHLEWLAFLYEYWLYLKNKNVNFHFIYSQFLKSVFYIHCVLLNYRNELISSWEAAQKSIDKYTLMLPLQEGVIATAQSHF